MKAFSFTDQQLIGISAGLIADEFARKFGRYTETLTLSRWSGNTKIGRGGIEADVTQQVACAARVASFFGQDEKSLYPSQGDTLADWAVKIRASIENELLHFRFHPSSQLSGAETRHNADDLFQDAAAVASLLQGRRRIISMLSPHNALGLISSVIAPNLLRLEVIDGRTYTPDELAGLLAFGDLIIATPTLWRYLAETLPAIPSNVMGVSFGERMTVDLAGRLRQRGIGALRELYGSTETGVIAWRDGPSDPFTTFGHWVRKESSINRTRSNGQQIQLLPMDDLNWRSPNSFDLGDRRDGAIQIGAVNVFPQTISAVITEHPDVETCEVRVSRRSGALDRLIADITLVQSRLPDQAMAWSIDEWCRKRLRPTERPRIYTFLPYVD